MLSSDGAGALLEGWRVEVPDAVQSPVAGASRVLQTFGATVAGLRAGDSGQLRLKGPTGHVATAQLTGWRGERSLHDGPANGSVLTAYAALRVAGAAVDAARRGVGARLGGGQLLAELSAPVGLYGGIPPELIRCRDGWLVARWREPAERELLGALVGPAEACGRDDLVAQARLARLLVAPVKPPPRRPAEPALGIGVTAGGGHAIRRRPRILDWSVLWAGPWASAQLQRAGAVVQRVEHPRRRDGLLGWPEGRRCWRRLNAGKRITLLDARRAGDGARLRSAIADAEILITSMTPRALRGLELDDRWRAEHAPHLLHLELVAFEPPWEDAGGLGEHAAAQAGLLWREGETPSRPAPWADPLLGAGALTLANCWLASRSRPGGRLRLSLERAAALAFAVAGDQSGIE